MHRSIFLCQYSAIDLFVTFTLLFLFCPLSAFCCNFFKRIILFFCKWYYKALKTGYQLDKRVDYFRSHNRWNLETMRHVYFRHFASGDTSSKEIFARLQRWGNLLTHVQYTHTKSICLRELTIRQSRRRFARIRREAVNAQGGLQHVDDSTWVDATHAFRRPVSTEVNGGPKGTCAN